MLGLKSILTLLLIGVVSTSPTDYGLDKRAMVCRDNDQDLKALKSNKADGSAFCSTYLQITKTSTVTPLASTTATRWVTKSTRLVSVQKVQFIVRHVFRAKVTKTASITLTKTNTATVTDLKTEMETGTQIDDVTDTDIAQVTETGVAELTEHVTRHVTTTVTATVYTTSTKDVTNISTMQLTKEDPTTVTVTSTADADTTTVSVEYNCGAHHKTLPQMYVIANLAGVQTFTRCKTYCATKPEALSFGYHNIGCMCLSALTNVWLSRSPSNTDWNVSDLVCPALTKPEKRAAQVDKRVPEYLQLKGASDVSSACSCHINNKPASPTTLTVNAKPVTHTVTSFTNVYYKIKKYITVSSHRTDTLTDFKTTTKTDYNTLTVTNRQSVTVTQPVTITVTHVKMVTVTKVNSVHVTNYNTMYTTDVATSLETDLETEIVTDVEYFTVTDYETVEVTVTDMDVIKPSPVTVTVGVTNYG
ncbi:hypothetical protein SNK04_010922 [Fusarium graminearum]